MIDLSRTASTILSILHALSRLIYTPPQVPCGPLRDWLGLLRLSQIDLFSLDVEVRASHTTFIQGLQFISQQSDMPVPTIRHTVCPVNLHELPRASLSQWIHSAAPLTPSISYCTWEFLSILEPTSLRPISTPPPSIYALGQGAEMLVLDTIDLELDQRGGVDC